MQQGKFLFLNKDSRKNLSNMSGPYPTQRQKDVSFCVCECSKEHLANT